MKRLLIFVVLTSATGLFCDSIHVIDILPLRMKTDTNHPIMRKLAEVQQKYSDAYAKEARLKENPEFLKEESLIHAQQVQQLSDLMDKYLGDNHSHQKFIKLSGNEAYCKERNAIIEQYEKELHALVLKYAPDVEKARIDMEADMEPVREKYRKIADAEEKKYLDEMEHAPIFG